MLYNNYSQKLSPAAHLAAMQAENACASERNAQSRLALIAVTMVASECDVIEAFVRHSLIYVDHVHLQFHNCYDTSPEIVARLIAEGLAVSAEQSDTPVLRREHLGDALVRRVAAQGAWDHILPLDADEFIVADSRDALEAALAGVQQPGALAVPWLSYVPQPDDDPLDPNPLTRIRNRLAAPHPKVRKVFFRAALLDGDDTYLADGNHHLLSRTGRAIREQPAVGIFLAHYPVRSAQQLVSKVRMGALARRLSPEFTEHQSRHWRALAADRELGTDMPAERLARLAGSYLDAGGGAPVRAPLATAVQRLRYPELIHVDASARLAGFAEALVAPALHTDTPARASEAAYRTALGELDALRRVVQRAHAKARVYKAMAGAGLVGAAAMALLGLAVIL